MKRNQNNNVFSMIADYEGDISKLDEELCWKI